MNIFTAFNDGYVLPTRVMLKSLIMNNTCSLDIFVFYSSLKQESIDAIKRLEEKDRVSFHFHKVEDAFLDDIKIQGRFSKETYYRLFAHRLFSEDIERVLWLDGDMIINGPLDDFYNLDFKGKTFVAVENGGRFCHLNDKKKAVLRMPLDSTYVNTGVMLFNLKDMREKLNDEDTIRYLAENQNILELADQDVFNGLLYEHFLVVDPKCIYNFFFSRITNDNKQEVYANARVIHYCGMKKPWRYYNPYPAADIWWKYAQLAGSEYKRLFRELYVSNMLLKSKRLTKMCARTILPQSVYNHLNNTIILRKR